MANDEGAGKIWKAVAAGLFGFLQLVALFYLSQIDARMEKFAQNQNQDEQRITRLEAIVASLPTGYFRAPRQANQDDN